MTDVQLRSGVDESRRQPVHFFVYVGLCLWLGLAMSGVLVLVAYANREAPPLPAEKSWPSTSLLPTTSGSATLLVFLHPKCTCSVASVRQLNKVCSQTQSEIPMTAVFYCPRSQTSQWARSDLWRLCEDMPGMKCVVDPDGEEALRFGISASGHVLLFDELQRPVFDGGITVARGHEGCSAGAESLSKLLMGKLPQRRNFPVFGCPIHAEHTVSRIAMSADHD